MSNVQVLDAIDSGANKVTFTNLKLYNGSSLVGTAGLVPQTTSSGYLYNFNFASLVVVPQAGSLTLSLRGGVYSYISNLATDNSTHTFQVSQVTAVGTASNNSVTPTLQSPSGNPMTVVR